jgi:hypothetical protein
MNAERSVKSVPWMILLLLAISLSAQILWHKQQPSPYQNVESLDFPPSADLLHIFSLGDRVVSARIIMLWLQAFDNQNGQFLSYKELNYKALRQWLESILYLDPRTEYPLLAASHLYSSVPVPEKKREMLDFIYKQFLIKPKNRWQWLSHAAMIAKHQLKDLPLALQYAESITKYADSSMPSWAREMQIFILEDMGELERARLVVGGLLASGLVTDANEIMFLNKKLEELEKKFAIKLEK